MEKSSTRIVSIGRAHRNTRPTHYSLFLLRIESGKGTWHQKRSRSTAGPWIISQLTKELLLHPHHQMIDGYHRNVQSGVRDVVVTRT